MAENKNVTNKVWLALLVVVLCCTLLSGYGCSSQAMSPGSSIQQGGDKDPIFTSCSCNDTGVDPGQDKDVGCCTCGIEAVVNATNATVTIGNAYPGYGCNISFTIRNTAAEPVNITSVNVTAPPAIDVSVGPSNLEGTTLDFGEEVEGFIDVHVNDSATQSTTYTFTVKIDGD